jgi:hypothetical protein
VSGSPLRLPLFPLGGAILFPRSHLPLHIFEPRYRQMIEDAVAGGGLIGMIQPKAAPDDGLGQPELYRVGCIGEIVGLEELGDGRFNVVLQGTTRFRLIAEADVGTPYRQADVVPGDDANHPRPDALGRPCFAPRCAGSRLLVTPWGDGRTGPRSSRSTTNAGHAIAQVAPFDSGAKAGAVRGGAARLPGRAA